MKKVLALVLALAMVMTAAVSLADELTITWWGSSSSSATYQAVTDMFSAATGIECETTPVNWDDYFTKLNTLAAADDMPDCLRMDYAYIANYVEKGLLEDLTPYIQSGAIDLSLVPDSAISGAKFGDGVYGINAGANGLVWAINAKMITDAGKEVPSNEMTWDEFIDWAIDYSAASGKYACDLYSLKDFNVFRVFAREHDEELYNEAQDGVGYSEATLVKYFTDLKKLQDAKAVQNVSEIITDVGKENYPVSKAEAASIITTTDSYTTYAKLLKDEYGLMELRLQPGAWDTNAMYVKPSQFLCISKGAENADAAAKYINAWTNDEAINLFINGTRGIPIATNISSLVAANLDEISALAFDYMNIMGEHSKDLYAPDPTAHTQIGDAFLEQEQAVLFGTKTAEQAAQDLIAFSNSTLSK